MEKCIFFLKSHDAYVYIAEGVIDINDSKV